MDVEYGPADGVVCENIRFFLFFWRGWEVLGRNKTETKFKSWLTLQDFQELRRFEGKHT